MNTNPHLLLTSPGPGRPGLGTPVTQTLFTPEPVGILSTKSSSDCFLPPCSPLADGLVLRRLTYHLRKPSTGPRSQHCPPASSATLRCGSPTNTVSEGPPGFLRPPDRAAACGAGLRARSCLGLRSPRPGSALQGLACAPATAGYPGAPLPPRVRAPSTPDLTPDTAFQNTYLTHEPPGERTGPPV